MFKNLFGKKKNQKAINVSLQETDTNALALKAQIDGDNTNINMELPQGITNEEYVALTSNTLLYISLDVITRYNLNPEAYIDLLKQDVLNALANSQRTVEDGDNNE